MDGKELINTELVRIGKRKVIKKMHQHTGWKEGTIKTALSRNKISKEMALGFEAVTTLDIKFWLFPEDYEPNGEPRKS
jgi:hypothetical protein